MILPIELQDKIFSYLDWETLDSFRELQSNYLKHKTKYNNLNEAILYNNIENLKWLRASQEDTYLYMDLYKSAINCNNFKIMDWLKANYCPWDASLLIDAITDNNLPVLKWLFTNNCPLKYNNNDTLTKKNLYKTDTLFNTAVVFGSLDMLEFLKAKNCKWSETTFIEAVESKEFDNMKWLKANNCELTIKIFNAAVRTGDLEILKWLKANNCPWDEKTFMVAAQKGYFEILKWLKANDCPWNYTTFTSAAKYGNIKIMKWLKKHNCPWNADTFIVFVEYNYNKTDIEWLIEAGCPLDSHGFTIAAKNNDLEFMKYLQIAGCPNDGDDNIDDAGDAFMYAADNQNLDMMKWLLDNKFAWAFSTIEMLKENAFSNKKIIDWLKETRFYYLVH